MPKCKKRKRRNSGRRNCVNVFGSSRTQDPEVPKRFETSHLTLPYAAEDACVRVETLSREYATSSTNQPFIFHAISNEYGEELPNPLMNAMSQTDKLTPPCNYSSVVMPSTHFQSPKTVRKRQRPWQRSWNKTPQNKRIWKERQLKDSHFTSIGNTWGCKPLNSIQLKLISDLVAAFSNYAQDLGSIFEPISQINISHTLSQFEHAERMCHCKAGNVLRHLRPSWNTRSKTDVIKIEVKNTSLMVELRTVHDLARKRGKQCCMFAHPATLNCTETEFESDGISNLKFENLDYSSRRSTGENFRLLSEFGHRMEMDESYLGPQFTCRPKAEFCGFSRHSASLPNMRYPNASVFDSSGNYTPQYPLSNLRHLKAPVFDSNGYFTVVFPLRSSTFKNKGKYKRFRSKKNVKKMSRITGEKLTPTVKLEVPEASSVKKSACAKNSTSTKFADPQSVDCNVQNIVQEKKYEIPVPNVTETPTYSVNSCSMCRDGEKDTIVQGNGVSEYCTTAFKKMVAENKMISADQKCNAWISKKRDIKKEIILDSSGDCIMSKHVKIEPGTSLSEGPLGINPSSEKNIVMPYGETLWEDLKRDPNAINSLEDVNRDSGSNVDVAWSEDRINSSAEQDGETPICEQSQMKGHVTEPITSMDIRTSLNPTPESVVRIESSSEIPISTVHEVHGSVMFEQSGTETRHSNSGEWREGTSRDWYHADSLRKLVTFPSTFPAQKRHERGTSRSLRISEGSTSMDSRRPIDIASSKLVKVRTTQELVEDMLKKTGNVSISSLDLRTALPELYKEDNVKTMEESSGVSSLSGDDSDGVQPLIVQDGECLDANIASGQNYVPIGTDDDQEHQPECSASDVPEKFPQILTDAEGHVECIGGNFDRYGNWKEFHESCDKVSANGGTLRILPWIVLD